MYVLKHTLKHIHCMYFFVDMIRILLSEKDKEGEMSSGPFHFLQAVCSLWYRYMHFTSQSWMKRCLDPWKTIRWLSIYVWCCMCCCWNVIVCVEIKLLCNVIMCSTFLLILHLHWLVSAYALSIQTQGNRVLLSLWPTE